MGGRRPRGYDSSEALKACEDANTITYIAKVMAEAYTLHHENAIARENLYEVFMC